METYEISGVSQKIIEENKLYESLIAACDQGVILCQKRSMKLLYINEEACRILGKKEGKSVNDFLEKELIEQLLETAEPINAESCDRPVTLWKQEAGAYIWIFIKDIMAVTELESISHKVLEINKELMSVFNEYGDESLMVTDGNGIIEFVGEKISETCGMPTSAFLGKSVYEMERQGWFKPSVTAKVIEKKSSQVLIQKTIQGRELVSVGAPLMDEQQNIIKVMSVTRDYASQMKISRMIAELGEDSEFAGAEQRDEADTIITCNDVMFEIKTLSRMIAGTNATVLITGETGTGKELVAKYICRFGERKNAPFVKVNCGSISSTIVESELFGYEEGAFTGARRGGKIGLIEAANGGTLFLDEISELPMEQQVKLLHVLQERILVRVGGTEQIPLDIRVIAATNKNLWNQVKEGTFREDLYYRLNVIPIDVPALRERREDIPLLAKHFFKRFCREYNKDMQLSDSAIRRMGQYDWPGNIRQLENMVERLVLTVQKYIVNGTDLPEEFTVDSAVKNNISVKKLIPIEEAIEELERQLISMALEKYETTVKAAQVLGINQSTVSRKMATYGIKKKRPDPH